MAANYQLADTTHGASNFRDTTMENPAGTAANLATPGTAALLFTPVLTRALLESGRTAAVTPNVVSTPPAVHAAFGDGTPLMLISSPRACESTEGVTLDQARRMVGGAGASAGDRDVRVPVSCNSLVEIVNGGVRLPGGVVHLQFVVKGAK